MLKIRKEQKEVLAKDCAGRVHQKQIQALRERGFEIEEGPEKARQVITGIRTPEGRYFRWTRNAAGFVSRITDPSDQSMEIDFDGNHQIGELRRNGRCLLQCQYSEDGNILDATFADGAHERLEYAAGQLVRAVNADEGETRFVWDAMLRLVAVVDPRGYSTWIDYDEKNGGLRGIVFPDGAEETYERGKDGIFTVKSNGSCHGTVTSDDNGATERVEFADGHFLIVKWKDSLPFEGANAHIAVAFKYDQEGKLAKEHQGDLEIDYGYDREGNMVAIKTSDGDEVRFRYNDDDLLMGLTDWSGRELTFTHDPAGSISHIQFPNKVVTRATTSPEGHYASIRTASPGSSSAPIVDEHYMYNERDRLIRREDSGNWWRYTYNRAGALVKCEGTKGTEAFSEYDLAGNRTRSELGDAAYDERNRILNLGRESFEHDQHGNLIRRFGTRDESYRYNGQGHLIEVSKTDGAKVEFAYDAFGRRIWKSSEDTITHYRWAGRQLLREWTERNNRIVEKRDYVFLPGENYPLAVRINGMPYYYHTDRLGTPLALTDATGRVVWKAQYSPFGEARILVEEIKQPLRFLGQYRDDETGLHYNVFRYYDPRIGRYITADPIRFGGGNTNFYTYANNDPVNQRDPDGLIAPLLAIGIVAGAALVGGLIGGAVETATAPPEESGWSAFKRGFGWGALGGSVGAAVPIIGAAAGLSAASIAGVALLSDAAVSGVEGCARDGASAGTFLKGAGVAVGTTVATLGLSKIPGVKRALGAVGKKLSSAADAAIGRTKKAYYKVFPADLAKKRSEKQLARQARKAAIVKNKALALEAANGADAHSLKRHGPDVTDNDLNRRLKTGIAPDGKLSPTPASTRFKNHNEWVQTHDAARAKIAKREGIDLSKPPPPGKEGPHRITMDHGRPIDDGFIGRPGTKHKIQATNPKTGNTQKVPVYGDTEPVSGLTRTTTTIEWNPNTQKWETVQHFPSAKNWDQGTGSYSAPP